MSYQEENGQRWRKGGVRYFRRNAPSGLYNAIIFGSSVPHQFWAWAVWSSKRVDEGIEFGLAAARMKANAAIDRLQQGEIPR